jgi:hypothetical protein
MEVTMKRSALLLSSVLLPAISFAQSRSQQDGLALQQLVDTVLHDVSTLHPGMRRSALNALFVEDGGLQFGEQTRYDYRRCPSIKMDVKFKSVASEERRDDIIVEISKPYLEYPFTD